VTAILETPGIPRMEDAEISAGTVAVAWSHISVAEAILADGMMPKRAFETACNQFHQWLIIELRLLATWAALPECGENWPPGPTVPVGRKWTTRCFAWSAEQNTRVLIAGGGLEPWVPVPGETRAALAWQTEMMRVYATGGGSLPQAARTALDQRCGRPRKRREPVGREWLAGEVTAALDGAWSALLKLGRPLPAERPRLAGDPGVACRCGHLYYDRPQGLAHHRLAYGHDPRRG
jgi:hypothetical protein